MSNNSSTNNASNRLSFDVVVIGSGPAGYVAAIRCSQLGLKTACIDKWVDQKGQHHAGGTCLNVGCIPSKALLEASDNYYKLITEYDNHGIEADNISIDIQKMMNHKETIVNKLTSGIKQLLKSNKVTLYQGTAQIIEHHKVKVSPIKESSETLLLSAENIIIATGSSPMDIAVAPVDNQHIVDSSGALSFDQVPTSLGIIGAGVIGLELGSVWSRLGTEVTLLEAQDDFLSMTDSSISKTSIKAFQDSGLKIKLGARVFGTKVLKQKKNKDSKTENNTHVSIDYEEKNEKKTLDVEKLLVAVGRIPNTNHLTANDVELLIDERGFINVDKYCRTNIPHIFAIGDVVRGPMLAHKGSEEGMAVAETIANNRKNKASLSVDLKLVPYIIYTSPEIAWVGQNEKQLQMQAVEYKVGQFPFAANGRAIAMSTNPDRVSGHVKILSDQHTDEILGVHILGENASELIAQAVISMSYEATTEDLSRTLFAHPTLSEALHEAALASDARAIHKINR